LASLLTTLPRHALQQCEEELRTQAVELLEQLASGQLDESERFATVALIADLLFPESGDADLDAEETAQRENAEQEARFAERVKQLMEAQQLTQAQLAEKIGIGQSSISMLLSRGCRPQRRTVQRLAEALGVKPEELWPEMRGK
jgi:predicted XRE-type DNA-binding protein